MIPKKAVLKYWEGPLPEVGHYLLTNAGSMYLVIGVKENTRPEPKSVARLDLLKLFPEDKKDVPNNAIIWDFFWTSR